MKAMFGKEDKNEKTGQIASEYPAWYFESHIQELQETIDRKERALSRGDIPMDAIPETKAAIAREKSKLDAIMGSKPTPSIPEKDKLSKIYKALSAKISETLFKRSAMEWGTADAHEEAKRMVQPIISLDKEELGLAKSCGIKPDGNGKVSRNNAAKIFKLIGKLIGEPTNIEVLREDTVR
ncbi:hypothetical protein KAR91_84090 [Candidatus Pacearchaeota archaeon]|nr:hypothetical protein [Candidatus Pacearchaeota archaeon]